MGGSPKVTYQSPKIEKDKSFEKYLEYQMDSDKRAEDRATHSKEEEAEAELGKKQVQQVTMLMLLTSKTNSALV